MVRGGGGLYTTLHKDVDNVNIFGYSPSSWCSISSATVGWVLPVVPCGGVILGDVLRVVVEDRGSVLAVAAPFPVLEASKMVATMAGISFLVSTPSSSLCLGRLLLVAGLCEELPLLLPVVTAGCAWAVRRPRPPRPCWELRERLALITEYLTLQVCLVDGVLFMW